MTLSKSTGSLALGTRSMWSRYRGDLAEGRLPAPTSALHHDRLMLDRPSLDDETIVAYLRDGYGLPIEHFEFVPLGNDSAAWTYHATTPDARLFVKVRRGARPAGILIPQFLRDLGLTEVVAAQRTWDGEPWSQIGQWSVVVYPFIDALNAMRAGLELDGWRRLGAFAARLHATTLPDDLAALVPREDFRPHANELASRVASHVDAYPRGAASHDELSERLVGAWMTHRAEIDRLPGRGEALAQR